MPKWNRVYPFNRASDDERFSIGPFEDTLTVQSELDSTKISTILAKFKVTGVLPNCGRVALPADVFLGGTDYSDLQSSLFEAKDKINKMQQNEVIKDADEHSPDDSKDGESRSASGLESPSGDEPKQ